MGKRAKEARHKAQMALRKTPLNEGQRAYLREHAAYEGDPQHKCSPGDFNLTPPAAPVPNKTACDLAGVFRVAHASALLMAAIEGGLVGDDGASPGVPKRMWVVREDGQVFEAKLGGTHGTAYHGFPIRKSEPIYDDVVKAWKRIHG